MENEGVSEQEDVEGNSQRSLPESDPCFLVGMVCRSYEAVQGGFRYELHTWGGRTGPGKSFF